MYFASPVAGERFYLRLLLTVVKGPQSFDILRTVNNVLHDTFKSACVSLGLLEDDQEWIQCLQEAVVMNTGYQLRRLFSIILLHCTPLHPDLLWNKFSANICDDLSHKLQTMFHIPNPTTNQINDYGMFLLNETLMESGKSLLDFPPMPHSTGDWSRVVGNQLIWEQHQIPYEHEQTYANVHLLNDEQHFAYNILLDSINQRKGTLFFLNGAARIGKTFVYNTIAAHCRSIGHIVIILASSGIASLLLDGGRTAHSRFSIPLDVMDNSVCGFGKQSMQAELFREKKLIIWDEVPMQHRYCVEVVDRTLQDCCGNSKPFGGITVILGGDFRQILHVVPHGVREQIIASSLIRSFLWKHVHVLSLMHNMRLNHSDIENVSFRNFLMEIGSNLDDVITLPSSLQKCTSIQDLILGVYPHLNTYATICPKFFTERTILADVNSINIAALDLFTGDVVTYLGADKVSDDDSNHSLNSANRYPNEYLNSLNPSGLPPFALKLKVGCPIMLSRNLAPQDGLCNGTCLMVVRCASRIIEARILTGEKDGNLVFIPRITLTPSSSEIPIHMSRRQFPIRLAFAMTINKSQGQSVKYVGIDLRTPVFSHGQLYVAFSRCTSAKRITVLCPSNETTSTTNIVYPEVLL